LRPEQVFIDCTAVINGNPNLKIICKQHDSGHEKEPIPHMGTERMLSRRVYDRPFRIIFPDRSQWTDGFQPDRKGGLIWYTDGSKANKCTGAGVYGYDTRQMLSFSLGQYTTVFQTKCMPLRHAQWRI
jgi:hypothetical protein